MIDIERIKMHYPILLAALGPFIVASASQAAAETAAEQVDPLDSPIVVSDGPSIGSATDAQSPLDSPVVEVAARMVLS